MLPQPHSHPWYDRHHHTSDGDFENVNPSARAASFAEVVTWIASRTLRAKHNVPPPVRPLELDALHTSPSLLRITWIGHATLLVQGPALTVLTDPMFGRRASPFSFAGPERLPALPFEITDLPSVDVVLLSHDHYDHLDQPSIQALNDRFAPLFLTPLGVADRLCSWDLDHVVAADWWQYVDFDGWRFHGTPAQHFSGRGLFGRNTTLWAGWYIDPRERSAPRLFFAGDTAYASHFATIRERLGAPDVACLPIGAYRPRRIMRPVHMNPEEAMQAFRDLGAEHFLPMHWGTFDLADEPIHEPAERLRASAARHDDLTHRVHVLDIGASFEISATPSSVPPSDDRHAGR